MSDDRNILGFIRTICANGESGRLEILAGAIQGELSFADGKLVDARVGHLTGFRAINAVAAMRDARFSFDPTFAPLASSSITASERVVLKQFFGIETIEPSYQPDFDNASYDADLDDAEEVTVVKSNEAPVEIPAVLPPTTASRFPYARALAAVLVIAVMAGAAVLIYNFRERRSPAPAVASIQSTPAPQNDTPSQPAAPSPVKQNQKPTHVAQDLTGKWNIVNTVETTSYRSFKALKIGFDLSINQTGSTFTGNGRKVSENGRSLPASSRTPIQVKGTINGDRIEATFFEEGVARKSNGRFVWRINKAGRGLTGTFATTAASSSGKSAATREL